MVAHVHDPRLDGAPDDRKPDERREHFRKERNDVDREHTLLMFRPRRRIASEGARTPRAAALDSLERGDFEGAQHELTRLLVSETAPAERAFLLNNRGVARVAVAARDAARDDFTASLACVPRYAPALTNLGNLFLEDGEIDAAIARYEEAIAADAAYSLAYVNLGAAYKRAGRFAEAVRVLRQAQRLDRVTFASRRRPS